MNSLVIICLQLSLTFQEINIRPPKPTGIEETEPIGGCCEGGGIERRTKFRKECVVFMWRIALKQVQWKRRDRLTVEFMVLEGQIAWAHERIREQMEHISLNEMRQ